MSDPKRFDDLRTEIESVSQEITALLDRRFELVHRLGEQKTGLERPMRDREREAGLFDRMVSHSSGAAPEAAVRRIFQLICDESVAYMTARAKNEP